MNYPVELSLSSYLPKKLKEDMLFINRISVGVIDPYIELFELKEIPEDADIFMSKHGAPVELIIIDSDEKIIVTHDQIGWWDEGEHTDELRNITLEDVNLILREHDGYLNIEIDEESEEILLYDDKVILSLIEEYDDEE